VNKTINISLTGHTEQYRLDEDAADHLTRYLDRAATRLHDDPDRAEVLGDLERSVGDKLATLIGSDDRVVSATDIDRILEDIGAVDTGHDDPPEEARPRPRGRRLQRVREGQQIAGVCNGLAAYADLRIDWVRAGFVIGSVFTAGLMVLVYVALAFILPIADTAQEVNPDRR
jgi:phage shock protein PspC (stress-responsive transcriptional regulator)